METASRRPEIVVTDRFARERIETRYRHNHARTLAAADIGCPVEQRAQGGFAARLTAVAQEHRLGGWIAKHPAVGPLGDAISGIRSARRAAVRKVAIGEGIAQLAKPRVLRMPNQQLATALRQVLIALMPGLPNAVIDVYLKKEIKELAVAQDWGPAISAITGPAFGGALDTELTNIGVLWVGNAYNFGPAALTGPTKMTAPEDLNALKKYSATAQFDVAKALTNVLRAIKTAERPDQT